MYLFNCYNLDYIFHIYNEIVVVLILLVEVVVVILVVGNSCSDNISYSMYSRRNSCSCDFGDDENDDVL